jgi:hypothetical protein
VSNGQSEPSLPEATLVDLLVSEQPALILSSVHPVHHTGSSRVMPLVQGPGVDLDAAWAARPLPEWRTGCDAFDEIRVGQASVAIHFGIKRLDRFCLSPSY